MSKTAILTLLLALPLVAQEASSGFDLRATASAEAIYSSAGTPTTAAFRAILYPTWKISKHWTMSGAVQVISRPYFPIDVTLPGYGVEGRVLQATIGYAQVWKNASLSIKAGQMPTAFGNFLLRYDDAANPLTGTPPNYGYYGSAVSTLGLTGAQIDAAAGKWDARLQLVNSSPANPRSVFDKDQYLNLAAGAGYTVVQGFRVGVSGYRGPYLDRQSDFFHAGESKPKDLPATAIGSDVEWAAGHWNIVGEWQRVVMAYHLIPDYRVASVYVEARRVLHPRWYVAARVGHIAGSFRAGADGGEFTVGYRPATHELIKAGYVLERSIASGQWSQAVVLQVVTTLHPVSLAWK